MLKHPCLGKILNPGFLPMHPSSVCAQLLESARARIKVLCEWDFQYKTLNIYCKSYLTFPWVWDSHKHLASWLEGAGVRGVRCQRCKETDDERLCRQTGGSWNENILASQTKLSVAPSFPTEDWSAYLVWHGFLDQMCRLVDDPLYLRSYSWIPNWIL